MPARVRRRWTLSEVERLVAERSGATPRFELVDGELLVTPAPSGRHQRIVLHLALALQRFLSTSPMGELRLGPAALRLSSGQYYEPDLCVVPATDGRLPAAAQPAVAMLVIEVLSPGSSRHDRITKRRAFQREAVPEYWVVDGDAEAIEIWHPSDERPALVDDRLVWAPVAAAGKVLTLDVRAFFAGVADHAPLPLI